MITFYLTIQILCIVYDKVHGAEGKAGDRQNAKEKAEMEAEPENNP